MPECIADIDPARPLLHLQRQRAFWKQHLHSPKAAPILACSFNMVDTCSLATSYSQGLNNDHTSKVRSFRETIADKVRRVAQCSAAFEVIPHHEVVHFHFHFHLHSLSPTFLPFISILKGETDRRPVLLQKLGGGSAGDSLLRHLFPPQ